MTEKDANDAPCHLSAAEASAWASGFNAAHDALAPILAEKERLDGEVQELVESRDAYCRLYHKAESRALAAEAALAAEREITKEAIDEIESWGAYASEYFRDKHDLAGTVADLRARAAAIRAQGE